MQPKQFDGTPCSEAVIKECLAYKTIAVVGMSPKPEKPSHFVAQYLKEQGYEIIPVNPGQSEIAGMICYPDLKSIGRSVDVVDVFRKPEDCPAIAEEAVAIGAKALWLQEGIVSLEAGKIAHEAGLTVVMDACLKVVHRMYSK